MSQNDFNLANQGFPSMRSDMNSALQALASNSSGATAPTTTYPYQWWYDETTDILKVRDAANAAWIDFATFDQGAGSFTVPATSLAGLTSTVAELNYLDGASTTLAAPLLANPQNYVDPENRIINGAFDFWQRGTSSTSGGYVAADRWKNFVAGGTVTQARQVHTIGDKFGSNTPPFYLRQTVSGQSAAGNLALTIQSIEGVRSYAGETITVLGWARRSSGAGNMTVEGAQLFGTGGSPSADVFSISPTTITLTSDWEPFAAVLTVPSIAGKTIGTNGNDHLGLNFWTSAGSDFNARTNSLGIQTIGVDLWGIHIKLGVHTADATALYKQPELGPELARCQRYYQVVKGSKLLGVTYTPNGDTRCPIRLVTSMRTTPSVTYTGSTSVIAFGESTSAVNISLGTLTVAGEDQNSIGIFGIGNNAAFTSLGPVMSWGDKGADGLFFYADAEL
jgi:hypothetical protein